MTNDESDDQQVPEITPNRPFIPPNEEQPNPRPRRRLPALPPHAQANPVEAGINLELHPVQNIPAQPGPNVQPQPQPQPQPSPNPQPRPGPRRSPRLSHEREDERVNVNDYLPDNGHS